MYNRNPIGSGAPDFAAMFAPPVYTPPKDATENNLSSIAALQDPTGTLQRMQAEKVIGAMADLKTDGIDNIYRQRALDAINGFQQFATGLYGKNTGLNRLTLDGQQQLEQTQKARETLTDLNALRGLSADYRKTIDEAAQDFKSGTITREDYNRFVTELDGLTSGAKSIGDLPMAHAVYNRFLMNKPEAYNLKKETEFANQMFGLYKQWNYTEGGTMGRNPQNVRRNIDNTFPPGSQQWAILDSELSTRNFYPPSAVTEDQRREFLTKASISGYNPKEVGQSNSFNINNQYGGKDKINPVTENKDGYTYHNFSWVDAKDIYGQYRGTYETVRVAPDGTAEVFLSQVVNNEGKPLDTSQDLPLTLRDAGAKADPNKAGGVWLPYTKSVDAALQGNNIITAGIGGKKAGYTPPGEKVSGPRAAAPKVDYVDSSGTLWDGQMLLDAFYRNVGHSPSKAEWAEFLNNKGLKPKQK